MIFDVYLTTITLGIMPHVHVARRLQVSLPEFADEFSMSLFTET